MEKTKLFSIGFFRDFQDKENFFEKLTSDKDTLRQVGNQYLLLNVCSFLYGIVMGSYNGFRQAISSGIKVPLLFSLALLVCFPAFFIIQHVLGSRLGFWQMFKVILSGFVMVTLVMVSFAPIVIFFLITGDNYSFLKLLHVAIFALSGFFGMKTILDALRFSCEKKQVYPKVGVVVFRFWILILAFVGMQLAWNLRPFIGSKGLPFELFRKREGNFYLAVIQAAGDIVKSEGKKTNNK
ncbi:MAG TPA: actin-binding WH2 domain-containing protein [Planctomycetes bacterium]|nr:actin-binding WH2 domain-containing protein [Planctomycetota bacterium]